jgi:hypothetical protein
MNRPLQLCREQGEQLRTFTQLISRICFQRCLAVNLAFFRQGQKEGTRLAGTVIRFRLHSPRSQFEKDPPMKRKLHSTIVFRPSSFAAFGAALLAALALFTTAPGGSAQNVTISAADFQRMVYGAHLHTQLTLKPELGASLQVLLEMQRRNPNATPAVLAGLSSNALQFYRANAPCYIRTNGYPDEILAAYLDGLRQLPAHTNFFPADLTLLNCFMLNAAEYDSITNQTEPTVFGLINSSDQRLYSCQDQAIRRQALVQACVARAQGNAAFATAIESLLVPETQVSLEDSAAAIIGNPCSPLHNDLTMQTLLALSAASSDGSLTVSTNQLMELFTDEMQTIQNTINTNLAVLAGINQSQPDYLAYLTNQAALDANAQLQAAVQQAQPAQIASATAAVLVQSQLIPEDKSSAEAEEAVSAAGEMAIGMASLCKDDMCGADSVLASGLDIFNGCSGYQSPQDLMAAQISNIETMVGDLSSNMEYRFDRVDQSLTIIYNTLNAGLSKINAQVQQLTNINVNVDELCSNLVQVQSSLDELENYDYNGFLSAERSTLMYDVDNYLLYHLQFPNRPFQGVGWLTEDDFDGCEAAFYVYAAEDAANTSISPVSFTNSTTGIGVEEQLTSLPLNANLNYIQQVLSSLGQSTAGASPLANPQEWFVGAYAYLELCGENPMWFRQDSSQERVTDIMTIGKNLSNFCASLTFITGTTNANGPLYTALENYYGSNLLSFSHQILNTESQFAAANDFNLGTWRQWDVAAPRLTATATEVVFAPPIPSITIPRESATTLAAGAYYSLALMTNGAVLGWGDNSCGQTTIPAGLTNLLAVAAGAAHTLALQADGTVLGWGDNSCGQTNVPAGLSNVMAITAGADHSLALQAGGTVAGWGDNSFGQTNAPPGLNNVVAITAGAGHSLALQSNGTVVGWGAGSPGSSAWGLSFDGVDDQVNVSNQAALNAYPLTISAWIKTTQTNDYESGIINKYWVSSFDGYQLYLLNGHICGWYFLGNQSSHSGVSGLEGGFVADGTWHNVAFVVDANGGRLSVDGILQASSPWTGAPGPTTTLQTVTLGDYPGNTGGYYSGLLDEVRIWNVARSQADIQADMMHRLKGTEPGLIAYWQLDDGTGNTATNSAVTTGSACNGALAGPT